MVAAGMTELLDQAAALAAGETRWWPTAEQLPTEYVAVHVYTPGRGMDTRYWDGRHWRCMNGRTEADPEYWTTVRYPLPPPDPVTAWLRALLDEDRASLQRADRLDGLAWKRRVNDAHRALLARHVDAGDGTCAACAHPQRHPTARGRQAAAAEPGGAPVPCTEVRILAACYSLCAGYLPQWAPDTDQSAERPLRQPNTPV
jgi:hypothetical protein